jgi:DNA-binding XRE family transcriptional regulator
MPRADLNRKYLAKFGKRLAELRTTRGLSRVQLASAAGLTKIAIILYENGKRWPSPNAGDPARMHRRVE